MQLLQNLRVAYKLVILAVVSFIGLVAVGFFGFEAMNSAEDDLNELYNKELMGMYYIGESRHAMRYAQLQTVLMPVAHTAELEQQRKAKYEEAVK